MPTLPSGQTSTHFQTQMSSLGGPASGSFLPLVLTGECVCQGWEVSDLPADMFPSFEADKKYELATGLLFWEKLNVSINFLLAGFPTVDRRWNSVEISQTPSASSKASASSQQGKQETPPWSPDKGAGLSEHFSASVVFACAPVLTSGRGELPCRRCRIWTHFFFGGIFCFRVGLTIALCWLCAWASLDFGEGHGFM